MISTLGSSWIPDLLNCGHRRIIVWTGVQLHTQLPTVIALLADHGRDRQLVIAPRVMHAVTGFASNRIDPAASSVITSAFLRAQHDVLARQRYDAIIVNDPPVLSSANVSVTSLLNVIAGHPADTAVIAIKRNVPTIDTAYVDMLEHCGSDDRPYDTTDLRSLLT